MKIAALLEDSVSAGGGFNQALNAVLDLRRLAEIEGQERFQVVAWTTRVDNIEPLRQLGIEAKPLRVRMVDRLIARLEVSQFGRRLLAKFGVEYSMERVLRDDGTDLVYFTSPSAFALGLRTLNYVTTVWDLCHRDHPEFPEVGYATEFEAREWLYRQSLTRAVLVVTDSEQLSDRLARRYGLDVERTLGVPFGPSPLLGTTASLDTEQVLRHYGLEPGFFFYPAQFWAHKNHVRILQAAAALRERGVRVRLVFAGGDKGNLSHVQALAAELGMKGQVHFLGFVPSEHMRGLYAGCVAVVMPTYFGPTNLPPLEAWATGKPLIYSSECAQQAGDAALLVDPDDASAIAAAMQCVLDADPASVDAWRVKGNARLAHMDAARMVAISELSRRLQKFALRRACWK